MKSILLTAACCTLLLSACNTGTSNTTPVTAGPGGMSDMAKKNLDAVHLVTKAFETGDVSGVDSVVSTSFVDHTDKGEVKGIDSMKAMIKMAHSMDSTMKSDIIKEV